LVENAYNCAGSNRDVPGSGHINTCHVPLQAIEQHGLSEIRDKSRYLGEYHYFRILDPRREHVFRLAAGVTLRFVLEMAFGYRNAPLWKMAASTGEAVFTPFYDVLRARCVSVKFFHRVTQLRPTDDGRIGEIDLSEQAKTKNDSLYQPLVHVNGVDCWPNQPDWTQLCSGTKLEQDGIDFESSFCTITVGARTLMVGRDFDIVVLAMPPEALNRIAEPLKKTSREWQTALGTSRSVATQALQLWMLPKLAELGWELGPTVLTAFAEPYDSWTDMSHLRRPSEGPGS